MNSETSSHAFGESSSCSSASSSSSSLSLFSASGRAGKKRPYGATRNAPKRSHKTVAKVNDASADAARGPSHGSNSASERRARFDEWLQNSCFIGERRQQASAASLRANHPSALFILEDENSPVAKRLRSAYLSHVRPLLESFPPTTRLSATLSVPSTSTSTSSSSSAKRLCDGWMERCEEGLNALQSAAALNGALGHSSVSMGLLFALISSAPLPADPIDAELASATSASTALSASLVPTSSGARAVGGSSPTSDAISFNATSDPSACSSSSNSSASTSWLGTSSFSSSGSAAATSSSSSSYGASSSETEPFSGSDTFHPDQQALRRHLYWELLRQVSRDSCESVLRDATTLTLCPETGALSHSAELSLAHLLCHAMPLRLPGCAALFLALLRRLPAGDLSLRARRLLSLLLTLSSPPLVLRALSLPTPDLLPSLYSLSSPHPHSATSTTLQPSALGGVHTVSLPSSSSSPSEAVSPSTAAPKNHLSASNQSGSSNNSTLESTPTATDPNAHLSSQHQPPFASAVSTIPPDYCSAHTAERLAQAEVAHWPVDSRGQRLRSVLLYALLRLLPALRQAGVTWSRVTHRAALLAHHLLCVYPRECAHIGRGLVHALQQAAGASPALTQLFRVRYLDQPLDAAHGLRSLLAQPTPQRYLVSRLSPLCEHRILFLLKHVHLGRQRRYQRWFVQQHYLDQQPALVCDLVRYVCGAFHPSNRLLASPVLPRWALLAWLLQCIDGAYHHHHLADVKLALFYDWFFFHPPIDNIMNIEPAILLMMHSIKAYPEFTAVLLEYLLAVKDHYLPPNNDSKVTLADANSALDLSVAASFRTLLQCGVVRNLSPLIDCPMDPVLRERFRDFLTKHDLLSSSVSPALDDHSSRVSSGSTDDDFPMDVNADESYQTTEDHTESGSVHSSSASSSLSHAASPSMCVSSGQQILRALQRRLDRPLDSLVSAFRPPVAMTWVRALRKDAYLISRVAFHCTRLTTESVPTDADRGSTVTDAEGDVAAGVEGTWELLGRLVALLLEVAGRSSPATEAELMQALLLAAATEGDPEQQQQHNQQQQQQHNQQQQLSSSSPVESEDAESHNDTHNDTHNDPPREDALPPSARARPPPVLALVLAHCNRSRPTLLPTLLALLCHLAPPLPPYDAVRSSTPRSALSSHTAGTLPPPPTSTEVCAHRRRVCVLCEMLPELGPDGVSLLLDACQATLEHYPALGMPLLRVLLQDLLPALEGDLELDLEGTDSDCASSAGDSDSEANEPDLDETGGHPTSVPSGDDDTLVDPTSVHSGDDAAAAPDSPGSNSGSSSRDVHLSQSTAKVLPAQRPRARRRREPRRPQRHFHSAVSPTTASQLRYRLVRLLATQLDPSLHAELCMALSRGHLRLLHEDQDLTHLAVRSLRWESFAQTALWQLLQAALTGDEHDDRGPVQVASSSVIHSLLRELPAHCVPVAQHHEALLGLLALCRTAHVATPSLSECTALLHTSLGTPGISRSTGNRAAELGADGEDRDQALLQPFYCTVLSAWTRLAPGHWRDTLCAELRVAALRDHRLAQALALWNQHVPDLLWWRYWEVGSV